MQRTHAQEPPEIPGVDPLQDPALGREDGPKTKQLLTRYPRRADPIRSKAFRSCLGIMRLANITPRIALRPPAPRALSIKAYSFKSVESILKKNGSINNPFSLIDPRSPNHPSHSNVRGKTTITRKEITNAYPTHPGQTLRHEAQRHGRCSSKSKSTNLRSRICPLRSASPSSSIDNGLGRRSEK